MTAGLFVGRFQPFHNGHLRAIEWVLGKCERVAIVIGSAQAGMEPENPFTAEEREGMVGKVLGARGWGERCAVISVEDVNNHEIWVSHIDSKVTRYDAIYSNSPLTVKLFRNAGRKVVEVPFFGRERNEGKRIREAMAGGDGSWRKDVPKEVEKYLDGIGAQERMIKLTRGNEMRKVGGRTHGACGRE